MLFLFVGIGQNSDQQQPLCRESYRLVIEDDNSARSWKKEEISVWVETRYNSNNNKNKSNRELTSEQNEMSVYRYIAHNSAMLDANLYRELFSDSLLELQQVLDLGSFYSDIKYDS